MPAAVYESDVVRLASTLLGFGAPDGERAAYRPDSILFGLLDADDEFDEMMIDISGTTSTLRSTLAALGTVQLAFEAAVAAVDYRIEFAGDYHERGGDPDEEIVLERLRQLASEPRSGLEVLELSAPGSFKAKLKAIVTTEGGRRKFLAIAALAAAVLGVAFPPTGPIAVLVVAAVGAGEAYIPRPSKDLLTERLMASQEADRKAGGHDGQDRLSRLGQTRDMSQVHRFQEDLDALSDRLRQAEVNDLASWDRIAALEANVQELLLTVANRTGSPPTQR